jgi:hypothetical protein
VRLKLEGKPGNRNALGAEVALSAGSATMYRMVMPTRSYLSQSELPVTFGLGSTDAVDKVSIRWPDGSTQELTDVPVDQLTVIRQVP